MSDTLLNNQFQSNDIRLVRQRSNLLQFVESNTHRFNLMRYSPTTIPTTCTKRSKNVQIGRSTYIPSLLGLISTSNHKITDSITDYPGVFMWEELHNEFDSKYYCPTAVRISILDYEEEDHDIAKRMELKLNDDNKYIVKITLVGDPCQAGCIINSPNGIQGASPNAHIFARKASDKKKFVHLNKITSKLDVMSDIISVQAICNIKSGEEILFRYDQFEGSSSPIDTETDLHFWHNLIDSSNNSPHCDVCYLKDCEDNTNKIILCSFAYKDSNGTISPCQNGRHKLCFRNNNHLKVEWYCPNHAAFEPPSLPLKVWSVTPPSDQLKLKPPAEVIRRELITQKPNQNKHSITSGSRSFTRTSFGCTPVKPIHTSNFGVSSSSQLSTPLSTPRSSRRSLCDEFDRSSRPTYPFTSIQRLSTPSPSPASSMRSSSPACTRPAFTEELSFESSDSESSMSSLSSPSSPESSSASDTPSSDEETSNEIVDTDSKLSSPSEYRKNYKKSLKIKQLSPKSSQLRMPKTPSKELQDKIITAFQLFSTTRSKFIKSKPILNNQNRNDLIKKAERDYQQLRSCCGTMQKVVAASKSKSSICSSEVFDSAATLITSRMQYQKLFSFKKSSIEANLMLQINQAGDHYEWNGLPVCGLCFCRCVGMSRSKLFRTRKSSFSDDKESQIEIKFNKKGEDLRITMALIRNIATDIGQLLPTDEGQDEHRVIPIRSQKQFILYLKEKGNLLSDSTIRRAIKKLKVDGFSINHCKYKGVARCDKCESISKAHENAYRSNNEKGIKQAVFDRDVHIKEWQAERDFFSHQKSTALREPWMVNTLTFDGMDQSKTECPHIVRRGKTADAQVKLNIREVAGLYFGGPRVCMGMTSFDNVRSKGAAASITCLEHMLNLQFEAMDLNKIADIPVQSNSKTTPINPSITSPPISIPPSTASSSTKSSNPKVPFMWAERLHLTFDNTASDAKNAAFFRFLGSLVAIGVFRYITISNLLVGHTHDIVDQIFSVWSKQLKVKDAPTLSELHKLFQDNYSTNMYELKNLVKKMETAAKEQSEAKSDDTLPLIADHLVEINKTIGVKPVMTHMKYCISDSWTQTATIPHITKPHHFFIRKEKIEIIEQDEYDIEQTYQDECVMLYSRYLATPAPDTSHYYPGVPFGPWTERVTLYNLDRVKRDPTELQVPSKDPPPAIPSIIDTEKVRRCIDCHVADGSMTKVQAEENMELLKSFDNETEELRNKCSKCFQFSQELDAIGPISQKEGADKLHEREKEKKKTVIKADILKHMNEDNHLLLDGFWTKWIDRANNIIRPYYLSRNIELTSKPFQITSTSNYAMKHPDFLPSDNKKRQLVNVGKDEQWRVEHSHLMPEKGDFVFVRGNSPIDYPIFLGCIKNVAVFGSTEIEMQVNHEVAQCDHTKVADKTSDVKHQRAQRTSATIANKNMAAAAKVTFEDEVGDDGEHDETFESSNTKSQNIKSQKSAPKKPTKSSKNSKKSKSNASTSTHSFTVTWWNYKLTPQFQQLIDNAQKVLEDLQTSQPDVVDKMMLVQKHAKAGSFSKLPIQWLEKYRHMHFEADTSWPDTTYEDKNSFIAWGSKNDLLTGSNTISEKYWKILVDDLCERTRTQIESSTFEPCNVEVATATASSSSSSATASSSTPSKSLGVTPMEIDTPPLLNNSFEVSHTPLPTSLPPSSTALPSITATSSSLSTNQSSSSSSSSILLHLQTDVIMMDSDNQPQVPSTSNTTTTRSKRKQQEKESKGTNKSNVEDDIPLANLTTQTVETKTKGKKPKLN